MKKSIYSFFVVATMLLVAGCSGDYRAKAVGPRGEITVIMDSSMWKSQTADAIRQVFGHYVTTVPRPYHLFDLSFRDFDNDAQLGNLLKLKNFIIAAPIDGNGDEAAYIQALLGDSVKTAVRQGQYFQFLLKDQWYRDQWSLLLTSTSDSVLARKIKHSGDQLVNPLLKLTFKRYRSLIFDVSEQTDIENKIWAEHGWKIRVPINWKLHIDTTYNQNNGAHTGFLTLRNNAAKHQNIRWFWAWWTNEPPSDSVLGPEWINQTRDSLLQKYFRGTFDSSYVTTEYQHVPVITDTLTFNGYQAYETRGAWHMTHDAMGGPFVNMMIKDPHNGRLFLIEFGQFAPKIKSKRIYVRRFRAILRSFESDSTWNLRENSRTK